jgi:asparagine synthase (glutamine-hydrolysing)
MVRRDGEGRACAIVFNGCVYNHRALREELRRLGHAFQSDHSDTEALLAGWRQWRAGVFDRAVAMMACAIWDAALASLFLFRSSPGEKPLYTAMAADGTLHAFASTPHALGALAPEGGWGFGDTHRFAVARWLAFGHAQDFTPWPGVDQQVFGVVGCIPAPALDDFGRELAPVSPSGEAPPSEDDERVLFRGGDKLRAERAWGAASNGPGDVSPTLLPDRLDEMIRESVEARLGADVPVGCLLSGGVDSSLVAAHAMRKLGSLRTICVRMPSNAYDESRYAQAAAMAIGSSHRTIDVSPKPAEDLVRLIESMGLPFGDSSLLPTYWACRAAREEVGVALSGDGGDELFWGYARYGAADIARLVGPLSWLVPLSLLRRTDPKRWGDRVARLLVASRWRSSDVLTAIFEPPDLRALCPVAMESVGWGRNLGSVAMRRVELWRDMPSDYLRKVDSASMLANLEVRAPFLDQTLMLAAYDLGKRDAMPGGRRKGLLRGIAKRYLPAEIIDRPKMGFAIPIGEWFRTDFGGMRGLLHDLVLNAPDPFPEGVLGLSLRRRAVAKIAREHAEGVRDHAQRLYLLVVLAIWCGQARRVGVRG